MEEVREVRLDEFDDLMAFLAKAYGYNEIDWFPRHYGHIYQRDSEKLKNSFIIKDKGRIVSHVGLFPLKVLVGSSIFKVGGIGGVATASEYRGQGLMGKLLKFVIDKMEKEEYAFSVLWGDRQRYGNFGWELGGRKLLVTLSSRSLRWKGIEAGDIRRYDGQPQDLEKIMALHERERFKVKRSKEIYKLLMERAGMEGWVGKESYMVLSGAGKIQNAVESGGSPSGILSLALTLIKEKGLDGLSLSRPYEDSEINRAFLEASSGWTVELLGSIKIINFSKTLEGFQKAIGEKKRDKYIWPVNAKELIRKMALPDDNLFNFYIWNLDHV